MSYNIKLKEFEGPFDLLFHLIEKAKVDIYNIPIAKITEQYMDYIENMKKFDLEIASEFLVMAATLIEIKSKMLLPNEEESQIAMDIEEEDPRKELVKRLIEYKKYKYVATEFKNREELHTKIFYKDPEQFDEYIQTDSKEIENMDMKDLIDAFEKLLKKRKKLSQDNINFHSIQRDEYSLEDKIESIKEIITLEHSVEFEDLFHAPWSKSEMVVTFLALLELIKLKFILVQQDRVFGRIMIQRKVINEVH
ncbi:segregation/condensation protein A [Inediibacterium massiliense]|uniref:segregation/condensation protein A n=1 Tax=Inediibacterium massiliense TaxID=1658111 RepID=UPI0006B4A5B0|nr:segregation/condensation protein A [Inediibacterium massiliense]